MAFPIGVCQNKTLTLSIMKGFTIYSLSKHAELGSLLESYCQRIGKLSSSNHDLDSLFSLLFEVSILFTEEKACYKQWAQ